jgi:hypothetical protein
METLPTLYTDLGNSHAYQLHSRTPGKNCKALNLNTGSLNSSAEHSVEALVNMLYMLCDSI